MRKLSSLNSSSISFLELVRQSSASTIILPDLHRAFFSRTDAPLSLFWKLQLYLAVESSKLAQQRDQARIAWLCVKHMLNTSFSKKDIVINFSQPIPDDGKNHIGLALFCAICSAVQKKKLPLYVGEMVFIYKKVASASQIVYNLIIKILNAILAKGILL